uniref:Uncharacterized protein n=1 Tax=Romanomermis culicivorax TaxID=13658 RepID=A0A915I4K2_ROMCU
MNSSAIKKKVCTEIHERSWFFNLQKNIFVQRFCGQLSYKEKPISSKTMKSKEFFPSSEFFVSSMILHPKCHRMLTTLNDTPTLDDNSFSVTLVPNKIETRYIPCPNCWRINSKFNCQLCIIRMGELASQKMLMDKLIESKHEILNEIERYYNYSNLFKKEQLDDARFSLRSQIRNLKLLIALRAENCASKLSALRNIRVRMNEIDSFIQGSLRLVRETKSSCLNDIVPILDNIRRKLIDNRKYLTSEIFRSIFPINVAFMMSPKIGGHFPCVNKNERKAIGRRQMINNVESVYFALDTPLESELTNATRTNYDENHWVYSGEYSKIEYTVLNTSRADDFGRYSEIDKWFLSHQTKDSMTSSGSLFYNPNITSTLTALSYASQLTDNLSKIFDIHLPFEYVFAVPTSSIATSVDFLDDKINENRFKELCLRLNARILILCLSQGLAECVNKIAPPISFFRPFYNLYNLMRATTNKKNHSKLCLAWTRGEPLHE